MRIDVTERGAVYDGKTDNTVLLQSLIDALAQNGGGELCFPAGQYLTGSLCLQSHITLHLAAGACLLASHEEALYPFITPEEVEGFTRGTRRGILYAEGATGVTVCGEGTIDGNGAYWWSNEKSDTTRPRTIQFINCNRIRIEGIEIINSPCWTINPICCRNVVISGVSIQNPYESPNTDGINPESCSAVRISDCCVDVGDDCITIKSGLEHDLLQKQYPCENITVTNCTLLHGHGGVVIGSEMSGGVRNVSISNCIFRNTDRGIRIKTRRKRGGCVENVVVNNLIMDGVMAGITFNGYYACGADANDKELFMRKALPVKADTPVMRDMLFSNLIMKNVHAAGIYCLGLPEMPVKNIKFSGLTIETADVTEGEYCVAAPDIEKSFGDGIVLENAEEISIENCTISVCGEPYRFCNTEAIHVNS